MKSVTDSGSLAAPSANLVVVMTESGDAVGHSLLTLTGTDPANCGNCNAPCPTKTHATAVCSNSQCSTTCDSGYSQCVGQCVDTTTDKQNCGTCGNICKGNTKCVAGNCSK